MNERIREDGDTMPIVGEIAHGPFSNPMLSKILKQFGKRAFGRSSACMEFEEFLVRISNSGYGNPKEMTCLEIGTFYGVSAVVLSQFFKHVICVSVDEQPVSLKYEIIDYLGINNITFLNATDNDHKAGILKGVKFDFAYLDGDHTHDTAFDFGLVKHCGRVLFHEYWPLQPPVWNLVNSLPKNELMIASVDSFAYWCRKNG